MACYAIFQLCGKSLSLYRRLPEKDTVTIHEERIRQLKPLLPARGEIGYITTVENDRIFAAEKSFSNVEYLAQYVLTQYTLAPLIVRNSPDYPLVVGNFLDGPPRAGFPAEHGLTPRKDFGDGLVLFQQEVRP